MRTRIKINTEMFTTLKNSVSQSKLWLNLDNKTSGFPVSIKI